MFWLLIGYCGRPGFGAPGDDERASRLAPLFAERALFPAEMRNWQQFWIAWRRLAAGLDEAAQTAMRDVLDPLLAPAAMHLLREKWDTLPSAAEAAVRLARVTDDRARDVSERVRREVERRLTTLGAKPEWIRAVREHVPVEEAERAAFFGEGLPVGLRLIE